MERNRHNWNKKPDIFEFLAHHGIKGQKWGVRRGPPYPLGENSPINEVLAKSRARDTIVQDAIRSGEVSKELNREKQIRHTTSEHTPGRSYIHGDLDYAQQLIDELSGTGEPVIIKDDTWTKRERVIASKVIGTYVDPDTGIETETQAAMIVYSRSGSHIYPRKEKK